MKTDEQLIADFVAGDSVAIEEIERRHVKELFDLAAGRYFGGNDLPQAFLVVSKAFATVRAQACKFDPRHNVRNWLKSIVISLCVESLGPRAVIGTAGGRMTFDEGLAALPAEHRQAFEAVHLDQLPVKVAARRLGVPASVVRSRAIRGLQTMYRTCKRAA